MDNRRSKDEVIRLKHEIKLLSHFINKHKTGNGSQKQLSQQNAYNRRYNIYTRDSQTSVNRKWVSATHKPAHTKEPSVNCSTLSASPSREDTVRTSSCDEEAVCGVNKYIKPVTSVKSASGYTSTPEKRLAVSNHRVVHKSKPLIHSLIHWPSACGVLKPYRYSVQNGRLQSTDTGVSHNSRPQTQVSSMSACSLHILKSDCLASNTSPSCSDPKKHHSVQDGVQKIDGDMRCASRLETAFIQTATGASTTKKKFITKSSPCLVRQPQKTPLLTEDNTEHVNIKQDLLESTNQRTVIAPKTKSSGEPQSVAANLTNRTVLINSMMALTEKSDTAKSVITTPVMSRTVTSSPVTSRTVTSSPVTSRTVTSSPVTSRTVTSSPVTSRTVTSSPVTSKASPKMIRTLKVNCTTARNTSRAIQTITNQHMTASCDTKLRNHLVSLQSETTSSKTGTTQSVTSKTGTTQSVTSKTGTTQSVTSKTGTTQSVTSKTGTTQSVTSKTGTTQSVTSKTGTTQSVTSKTGTTQSVTSKTGTTQSVTSKTGTTQSVTSKTGTTQSVTSKTGTTQSVTSKTGTTQSVTSKTGTTQSVTSKTGTTSKTRTTPSLMSKTGTIQSVTSKTGTTQSVTSKTGTTQSVTSKTGTTQSVTSKTGTTQSVTSKTGTTQSVTSKTGTTSKTRTTPSLMSKTGTIQSVTSKTGTTPSFTYSPQVTHHVPKFFFQSPKGVARSSCQRPVKKSWYKLTRKPAVSPASEQKQNTALCKTVQANRHPLTSTPGSNARWSKVVKTATSKYHWYRKAASPGSNKLSVVGSKPTAGKLNSRYKLTQKTMEMSHKKRSKGNMAVSGRYKFRASRTPGKVFSGLYKSRSNLSAKNKKTEWTKKFSLKRNVKGSTSTSTSSCQTNVNLSHSKFKFINGSFTQMLNGHKQRYIQRHGLTTFDRRPSPHQRHVSSVNMTHQHTKRPYQYLMFPRKSRFVLNRKTILNSVTARNSSKTDRIKDVASRVLQRSIYTAHLAKFKKVNNKTKTYCLYYNRFGKCHRGDKCHYIHDPARVAICTRFLRGRCDVTNCPFSHQLSKEKMPVCRFFIRGVCSHDNCPYIHSKVSKDAKLCEDFIQGFCKLGEECKKKHILICPDYKKYGSCPHDNRCKLKHVRKKVLKRKQPQDDCPVPRKTTQTLLGHEDLDDVELPLSRRRLPSYIPLDDPLDDSTSSQATDGDTSLLIHPRLSLGGDTVEDADCHKQK